MLSAQAYAHRAAPDPGGVQSALPWGGSGAARLYRRATTPSKFPHISQDLVAKSAQSALFAAGSALRFTKSKRLAATLPQMTLGPLNNGPTLHEVTQ
ncbi:hypothetical protein DL239_13985 [Sedimentitalea sp. CY04]|uniref:Uncharacterized protein n=1 Tax=Parasedimentitalea denitrificans TaxID=2211118 RepID=A0ABX0WA54_9RHOB|nr:hypothetical protein [Sedimentitalea sp. CY04]